IEGEVVTVVAERSIIRPDVATSVVAVTTQEVQELPVSNIESVVGLQAGIQSGLQIRGGGADEALVLMDGITLRDPRNNNPVSSLALSSIKEISVERGGFNAEYGQVRSGIVNVVTKEGSKSAYHGNIEFKYSPPAPKYFGISPFDKNSGYLRPYYDDAVCWTGTANGEPYEDLNQNGVWDAGEPFEDYNGDGSRSYWDIYTQRQYPEFEGWNAVSQRLMSDSDPTNDLSPLGAQRKFMWETRKEPAYDQPDYNIDAGFGGPVPFIGENLGNLRFFTTYRRYREMLLVPLSRDDYVDYNWSMKLTSDITPSMKLMLSGLIGKQYTMQQNDLGFYVTGNYLRYPGTVAGVLQDGLTPLFGTGVFSLTDISHTNLAAKLTHVLNVNTFYEVSLEHFRRDYYSRPPHRRDKTKKYEIVPGYFVDEAPFGYDYNLEMGEAGMLFGGFTCLRRDNTKASSTTLKADLSSQVNFSNLVKARIEFVYNDLDFDYGIMANFTDTRWSEHVLFHAKPIRAAVYLQDKLETKGFIMNLGMRLDYSNSNTKWWDVDIFDKNFFTSKYSEDQKFNMVAAKSQCQLSPRLGISHPITENSKLFFNYGHFKQMPAYETLFHVGRAPDRRLISYGDPDLILAKTISYELGYDHALFNDYLIQLAAFYHDIFDQQNTTVYTSVGGISYTRTTSNSYEDIRGLEITLRKNRGRWWTFFGNYTYQVNTAGSFGRAAIFEDPSRQKLYDEATVNLYQQRPVPRPYARFNLSVYTPDNYGPALSGIYPLGGYMANLLLNWQAGQWETWNPKGVSSIVNNVQQTDYFNAVLRLSKTFNISKFRIQAFVDINNLFNYRRMSLSNFGGRTGDRQYYYDSLHLPPSEAYDNIPGTDRIGTYRKEGVAYQPMFPRGAINYEQDTGDPGVIYYDKATGRYVEYVDGAWRDVEKGRLKKILDDKAYIDMPNLDSFTFLNPRQIFFGIRVSFNPD
ncbi:MAG: TonB-dependent receptor, partial [candidate division KSB1 bacterium]|nr:TonB-dependent receptor [candidate division KSB1 bacterium]